MATTSGGGAGIESTHRIDTHLRTAVELNNIASALLDSRDRGGPGPVLETLKDAVGLLMTPRAVEFRPDDPDDEKDLREYVRTNNDAVARAEVRMLEFDVANKADDDEPPPPSFVDVGGALLVHARPFLVREPPRGVEINAEEVSAAVLYNMALAHHLGAAELSRQQQLHRGGPSSSSSLSAAPVGHVQYLFDKALSFYELCSTMLSQLEPTTTGAVHGVDFGAMLGPEGIPRLLEALLNNMGQVLVEHGDRRRGEEYFVDLERLRRGGRAQQDVRRGGGEGSIHPFEFNALVVREMTAAPSA